MNNNKSKIPLISDHVVKSKKDLSDTEFGYYLAGFIEGSRSHACGNNNINHLEISCGFDVKLAYYLKKRIGHGTVKYNINYYYICNTDKGLTYITKLINNKLVYTGLENSLFYLRYKTSIIIESKATDNILSNHWLCGFIQATGEFTILVNSKAKTKATKFKYKAIGRPGTLPVEPVEPVAPEIFDFVTLDLALKHNQVELLNEIILYLKNQNKIIFQNQLYSEPGLTLALKNEIYGYRLSFICLRSVYIIINYLSNYKLFGNKYIEFLKFRKAYIYISQLDRYQNKV